MFNIVPMQMRKIYVLISVFRSPISNGETVPVLGSIVTLGNKKACWEYLQFRFEGFESRIPFKESQIAALKPGEDLHSPDFQLSCRLLRTSAKYMKESQPMFYNGA